MNAYQYNVPTVCICRHANASRIRQRFWRRTPVLHMMPATGAKQHAPLLFAATALRQGTLAIQRHARTHCSPIMHAAEADAVTYLFSFESFDLPHVSNSGLSNCKYSMSMLACSKLMPVDASRRMRLRASPSQLLRA